MTDEKQGQQVVAEDTGAGEKQETTTPQKAKVSLTEPCAIPEWEEVRKELAKDYTQKTTAVAEEKKRLAEERQAVETAARQGGYADALQDAKAIWRKNPKELADIFNQGEQADETPAGEPAEATGDEEDAPVTRKELKRLLSERDAQIDRVTQLQHADYDREMNKDINEVFNACPLIPAADCDSEKALRWRKAQSDVAKARVIASNGALTFKQAATEVVEELQEAHAQGKKVVTAPGTPPKPGLRREGGGGGSALPREKVPEPGTDEWDAYITNYKGE